MNIILSRPFSTQESMYVSQTIKSSNFLVREISITAEASAQLSIKSRPDFYLHETTDWLVMPYELSGLTPDEIREHKNFLSPFIER